MCPHPAPGSPRSSSHPTFTPSPAHTRCSSDTSPALGLLQAPRAPLWAAYPSFPSWAPVPVQCSIALTRPLTRGRKPKAESAGDRGRRARPLGGLTEGTRERQRAGRPNSPPPHPPEHRPCQSVVGGDRPRAGRLGGAGPALQPEAPGSSGSKES